MFNQLFKKQQNSFVLNINDTASEYLILLLNNLFFDVLTITYSQEFLLKLCTPPTHFLFKFSYPIKAHMGKIKI